MRWQDLGHNVAAFPAGTTLMLYERCSTKTDQDLASQDAAMRAFAKERGYIITRVYADEGVSGRSDQRRQFERMIADAIRQPLCADVLLLWDYARFARDINHAQYYLALLRMNGWQIQSMNDRIPTDETAPIMEALVHTKNAFYSRDVGANTSRGMRFLAERGYLPNSGPLPGYRVEMVDMDPPVFRNGEMRKARKVLIDDIKAPRLRKAFMLKANGATQSQILAESNLYDSRLVGSRRWGLQEKDRGIQRLFVNKAYIGQFKFGEVIYTNVYPRLIEEDLWQAVQDVIDKNRAGIAADLVTDHPRRKASDFFLSGRARCADCGRPLVGSKGGRRPTYYNYYRCRGCVPNWHIPAELLETEVINEVLGTILQPQMIADLSRWTTAELARGKEGFSHQYEDAKSVLDHLLKEQSTLDTNIAFLGDLASSGLLAIYKDHRAKVEAQQLFVETLARSAASQRIVCTAQEVDTYLREMGNILSRGQMRDNSRSYIVAEILDKMVADIRIHADGACQIYVHLPSDWVGR